MTGAHSEETTDDGGTTRWGMLYPFLAVKSKGGPYDDDAFVGGAQLGRVDTLLQVAETMDAIRRLSFTVRTTLVKTLELAGMARGFPLMEAETIQATDEYPAMPEWSTITFRRTEED